MSATGLQVFDETLHVTHTWLKDLMGRLDTGDRHLAYLALRATLHALRDRLDPERAVHLGAQLPMLVRGFYYEGWKPSQTPRRERHVEEFLGHITHTFRTSSDIDAEFIARAVFGLLSDRLTEGEVRKVIANLPREVRALWPNGH